MTKRCGGQKIYTLRHFLFYMGVFSLGGVIVGAAAAAMDWSTGLVYAVGLLTALAISSMALREGLLAPAQRQKQPRNSRHA